MLNQSSETNTIKEEIFFGDWQTSLNAADKLVVIGGQDIFGFFISLLDSENSDKRNIAALSLRELRNNDAIEPLLATIFKQKNVNENGTLAYALEELDCSNYVEEIFQILFFQGYEAKLHAYTILCDRKIEFNERNAIEVKLMYEDLLQNPSKGVCFEKARDMIEFAFLKFLPF